MTDHYLTYNEGISQVKPAYQYCFSQVNVSANNVFKPAVTTSGYRAFGIDANVSLSPFPTRPGIVLMLYSNNGVNKIPFDLAYEIISRYDGTVISQTSWENYSVPFVSKLPIGWMSTGSTQQVIIQIL